MVTAAAGVATVVTLAVDLAGAGVDRGALRVVGFAVVISVIVLFRAWRPAVFAEGDRLVLRNLLLRQVIARESIRMVRIARFGDRTVSVWVVTTRRSVVVDATSRPRGFPGRRDLDADLAVLNAWLADGAGQSTAVSYLP